MDVISDIIKVFRRPADVPAHIRKLQQLLPLLAVQDSVLKQRIQSYTSSSISIQGVVEIRKLKKFREKYARLKRKLTLLQRQYKGHPLKQAKRVLYYIKILKKVVHATDIRMPEMHRQIHGGHCNQSNDSVMKECVDVSHVMHPQTSSSRQASQNNTGDLTNANFQRDVIVEHPKNGLQRITDLHPSFMSMNYPLIHPYGEDGYRHGIPLDSESKKTYTRTNLTMRQFYGYRIQQYLNEGHTLLQAGRLLQQYIVDGYMAIEEERFRYIRKNQQKLRSDLYGGLMDTIVRGDSDCSMVGKTIILPSSHTGGPRYRAQNYQDAMAICRWARYPDVFLNFTCNPKWPKINAMTRLINQDPNGCWVDIIC
ncbi:hypothetical protein KY289_009661 [Solanum tuberosum]|nr:hypothetical protein KY289_009661 [Solanum tuberosum]